MKFLVTTAFLLVVSANLFSQVEHISANHPDLPEWASLMYADEPDWGGVMEAFHAYYANHSFEKNTHTQYLKRALRDQETYHYQFADPRLSAETRLQLKADERQYLQNYNAQEASRSGNWSSIGPWDWDHDAAGRSYAPGAAHVYTVEQCGGNSNIMFAGTSTAGLWRSTDHGGNWVNVTKELMVNQVYAIEINPSNCDEVYAGMLNGIYKSTNGGNNWAPTGSASFQSMDISVKDIKVSPAAANIVFAATAQGFYRSIDNGTNWVQIMSGSFQEIEFHPSDETIVYIILQTGSRTEFYKSTNSGIFFVHQTNGWPVPNLNTGEENRRAEIAVSPASPNKVYALLTGDANGGNGLYGIYTSNDAGANWTFNCCGPQPGGTASDNNINMMGWDDNGLDNGGQYYYDLALAVSPTDANKVFVGGVNMWVSDDGGNSFTCPAKWSHPDKPEYVHADIHDINFYPTGDLWVANDGGIFHSTNSGSSFDRSSYGIEGSDFWGFGIGFNNDELMLGGAYHNGTLLKNGAVYDGDWVCIDGGDGVGGAVNPILEKQVYSDRNIKTMPDDRTISPSTRGYALEPSWTYVSGRFSQIEFAKDNYNVHYFGQGTSLYKTEDDNRTVSELYDFGEEVGDVEVAWTNPNVMYVATFPSTWGTKKLYKSSNAGNSWTEITPPSSAFSSKRHISFDVEVSYEDENLIWLARIGRQTDDLKKMFRSSDGGTTWSNITDVSLSGEVLTNVISQRNSGNNLYLGTTRSVYHSSGGNGGWALFADGLPASTRSRQLAISYRNGTLINATNRSVWVSSLAESSAIKPQISVDKYYSGCERDIFQFADYSTAPANANFQWSFPGASWVSSTTARDPEVIFGEAGNYSVSLTINGETQTLSNFIEIGDECSPEEVAGNALQTTGNSQYFQSTGSLDITTNTMTISGWIKPDGNQNSYAGIVFRENGGAGINFRNDNELGYHWLGTNTSTHWAYSTGLYLPADEWSFIAVVFTPNQITFYLNEEKQVRNLSSSLQVVDWEQFRIGHMNGWTSRNFHGDMDEVAIWNRALNQDEIRDWRHLTKKRQATPSDPLFDADMTAYFQFNESSGPVYDRKGTANGILIGMAQRVRSTAPVGSGSSSRLMIDDVGTYNFTEEKVSLTFPSGGTYPGEEVVVTSLKNAPTDLPLDAFHNNHYWIINNYGNETFSELEEIEFGGLNGVNASTASHPEVFTLNKRPSNAHGADWGGGFIDQADEAISGGRIIFNNNNNITSFSQFVIGRDASLLPVEFLDIWLKEEAPHEVTINWATASEKNTDYFVVERSKTGDTFTAIGKVTASNTPDGDEYQLLDQQPYQGINYYRVKSVDFDGKLTYTPIRSITLAEGQAWAQVYPNPIGTNNSLHLNTSFTGESTFELFATDGRLLRTTHFSGSAYLRVGTLPKGIYTYRISNADQAISGQIVNP